MAKAESKYEIAVREAKQYSLPEDLDPKTPTFYSNWASGRSNGSDFAVVFGVTNDLYLDSESTTVDPKAIVIMRLEVAEQLGKILIEAGAAIREKLAEIQAQSEMEKR